MTLFNLGSVNGDHFYNVPHIPMPGETLAATNFHVGLGGKGTNMSVAATRAGSRVVHIGAVGPDGQWAKDRLNEYSVDTRHVTVSEKATGHAIVTVSQDGENAITLFPGANTALTADVLEKALEGAKPSDIVVTQNETNLQKRAAQRAKQKGLTFAYAAAPFDPEKIQRLLPWIDLLFMNEVEAAQLSKAIGKPVDQLGIPNVIITLGEKGVRQIQGDQVTLFDAIPVKAVDTTGAGDTFTGYTLAGLDQGMELPQAIRFGIKAAAIMVTRHGTADVIPTRAETDAI